MRLAPGKLIKRRRADEAGFSIVEVLMAILLITAAIVPLITSLAGARRSNLASMRTAAATHEAQFQMELLRLAPYPSLGLTTTPTPSADPADPDNRLTSGAGGPFLAGEPVVTGGTTLHTDAAVVVRNSIRLRVFRYVTWRSDDCVSDLNTPCGSNIAKRITVAVVPVTSGTGDHPPKAVWLSTVKAGS